MSEVYAEALRVAERLLDHQSALLLATKGDIERVTKLAVAAIAGAVAGTGLALQRGASFAVVPTIALAAGVLLLVVATVIAMGGSLSFELTLGPRVAVLYRQLGRSQPTLSELQFSLLDLAAVAERHNEAALASSARLRQRASQLLVVGAGTVLFAFAYLVGGTIVA